MQSCLTPERLRQLLDDQADPAERAPLEAHLNGCPDCQRRLHLLLDESPAGGLPRLYQLAARTTLALEPFLVRLQANPPTVVPLLPAPWPTIPGYQIHAKLGGGGMGIVYRAWQESPGRLVAVKMIRAGDLARSADLARFRSECEALARLRHPHVVPIHEVGDVQGRPYFTMEFVAGGSLDAKLASTPLPSNRAAELVELLAHAVSAMHQLDIVHRDLKPANVLLAPSDDPRAIPLGDGPANVRPFEPKIADFGLAKLCDADSGQTQSGAILGTPSYMAPEQAAGRTNEVGPAADVYALGAILYETLTGRPPFRGATRQETLAQVCADEPVPPSRLRPGVPRDLETICLKCLEKEPSQRFTSARTLAEDLRHFLDAEPLEHARPPSLFEWLRHTLERRNNVRDLSSWRNATLGAAACDFVGHAVMFGLIQADQPVGLLWLWLLTFELCSAVAFQWLLKRRAVALNTAEQEMRLLWVGNTLAYLVLFWVCCPPFGPARAADALHYYPPLAVVVGLTFFVEGRLFWGRLYVMGMGYFVLAAVLPLTLDWAPLLFAVFDAAALTYGGLHLHRLTVHLAEAEQQRREPD